MSKFVAHYCTICGREKNRRGWFLVAENRWEDKLKILQWDDGLAIKPGAHEVCGAAHVRELARHWMSTGSLRYPFPQHEVVDGPGTAWNGASRLRSKRSWFLHNDLDTSEAQHLGELSVHRESVKRVLGENPDALGPILDELVLALRFASETTGDFEQTGTADGVNTRPA